jgi:hypothetical protein
LPGSQSRKNFNPPKKITETSHQVDSQLEEKKREMKRKRKERKGKERKKKTPTHPHTHKDLDQIV